MAVSLWLLSMIRSAEVANVTFLVWRGGPLAQTEVADRWRSCQMIRQQAALTLWIIESVTKRKTR